MDGLDAALDGAMMQRLRAVLAEQPDAVVSLHGRDHALVWADEEQARAVYGRARDDYQGREPDQFMPEPDASRFAAALDDALAGSTVEFRGRAFRGDGIEVAVRTVLWPTPGGDHVVAVSVVEPVGPDLP